MKPKCRATNRAGEPCGNYPLIGGVVCRFHGGASPQARAKARERLELARAGQYLSRLDVDLADGESPIEALMRELWRSAAVVEGLGELVDAAEAIEGPAWIVALWNEERDRHARIAKMAIDAGATERQIRILERQAEVVAQVIRAVLEDPKLGLPDAQRAVGLRVAARHLRAVS